MSALAISAANTRKKMEVRLPITEVATTAGDPMDCPISAQKTPIATRARPITTAASV